jgi:hypothetical protein
MMVCYDSYWMIFGVRLSSNIKNTQRFEGQLSPRLQVWLMGKPIVLGPME